MTAPATPTVIAGRLLPADISDQKFTETFEAMQRQLRDQGIPDDVARVGVIPQDDGTWLLLSWQAFDPWTRTFPEVANPQDYSFPATN